MRESLLAIVGPTAAGKSTLAMELARSFDGEIISADSRQVYRHFDIGTAKPSHEDRAAIPHHLIDIADLDGDYSLALFIRQATEAIRNVKRVGRLPVLTGGTGQYVWALLEGWQVPNVPPNAELREALEERGRHDPESVYADLAQLDPAAAERIDPRNVRRVIRAIEVRRGAGGVHPRRKDARFDAKVIGLTMERSTLYRRIDERVDRMMAAGWLDEVRDLLDRGYDPSLAPLSSLGYQELVLALHGDLTHGEAVQRIKFRTHQFARRQYAWFRLGDPRISWFDASASLEPVSAQVGAWLTARQSQGPAAREALKQGLER